MKAYLVILREVPVLLSLGTVEQFVERQLEVG